MWTPLWFLVGLVPVGLAAAMSGAMNLDFGFILLVALTMLVAWGAFLSGVLFAICGIMGAGSGFHGG